MNEPLRMGRIGPVEDELSFRDTLSKAARVDVEGSKQGDASMMMLLVVPVEEVLAERTGVLDTPKAAGEIGTVFERLEVRLTIRVVVRYVRARMRLRDAQVRKQKRHSFGGHGGAAVGVQRELLRLDVLTLVGFCDELLGQGSLFTGRHHPANHVSAENVDDDVEMVVTPFCGAAQFRYVPAPELIGRGRKKLWLAIRGMSELVASFAHFSVLREDAVHCTYRAQVAIFLKKGRIHFSRRKVCEAYFVERRKNLLSFVVV